MDTESWSMCQKKTLFGKERYEKNIYENRITKNYTNIVSITYNSRRNVLTIIIITEQMQIQAMIIIGIHTTSKIVGVIAL